MNSKLISVIVPVYNVEKYLRECVDSILSSTYKNLEIILIDDGSTDNSGIICDEYRDKDNRIVVIHQKNSGVSIARNKGLDAAQGEYIAFVDSDDIISPVMYENMLWAIEATGADLATCESTRDVGKLCVSKDIKQDELHISLGYDECLSVLINAPQSRSYTWTNCMVWNKLYCRRVIKKYFQENSKSAEDLLFNFNISNNCNKIVILPYILYFYRYNETSIMNTPSIDKHIYADSIWSFMLENAKTSSSSIQTYLKATTSFSSHNTMWRIVRENKEKEYSDYMKEAEGVVLKYFRELINHEDTELKVKIPAFLFKYCRPLWRIAAKLHRK